MPFPTHLQPLPSVISDPWQYFQVVHMMQSVEQCNHMKLEFCKEMGASPRFHELLLYVSKNILDVRLERFENLSEGKKQQELQKTVNFKNGVIALNFLEKNQNELKTLYKDLKPLQRERVSLL